LYLASHDTSFVTGLVGTRRIMLPWDSLPQR
jgi:hypothetical protein